MDDIGYLIGMIAASCAPPTGYTPSKGQALHELSLNVLGRDWDEKSDH